jgi:hypothetical protein
VLLESPNGAIRHDMCILDLLHGVTI